MKDIPDKSIDMIKVFEAFAGIGTQRMALRNLGIEHEVVAIAEIDKFAIKSYEAIHGDVNNLGDISKIKTEDIPDHDLFTYSFPCQDISVAGKQAGLKEGSGTRSGLLWECEKVIEVKRPKYLLMENVKNLVGKKFKADFDKWLERLEKLGYSNYWKVLKSRLKDEGNESVTNCNQLKMQSSDGKYYKTDAANTKGILRIIQSVPSPKAEPFKLWLAQVGSERIDAPTCRTLVTSVVS